MVTLVNTVDDAVARQICRDHGDAADALLEVLHDVQAKAGYLSDAALRTIAGALNLSRAEVHGVVTFYHDFRKAPEAKLAVHICRAEACQAVGAQDLIARAQILHGVTLDQGGADVELKAAYCLGNCALGPAVMIDHQLYGRVDAKRLSALIAKHQEASP